MASLPETPLEERPPQELAAEIRMLRQRLAAAEQAKREFLSIVSHELRTPMNAMLGTAELLLETPINQEQRDFINVFQINGEMLLTIINDILDLSKIESGRIALDAVNFDLLAIVERTCELLAPRAHAKGLELNYILDPVFPSFLIGDPGRLRQVLMNLIGNAIKFTPSGEVVVKCELLSLSGEDVEWQFSVSDTGIGIPEKKLRNIFELFTQGDSSSSRAFGGTGVGLTISQHLVELMHGRIWGESVEGKGSAFYFTAKFLLQPHPPKPDRRYPEELKGLRILIVDDNETNRRNLRGMLERWDTLVTDVKNGEQGVLAIRRAMTAGTPFDLILIDEQMPTVSGAQMIEHIKNDPAITGMPILMLSQGDGDKRPHPPIEKAISAYMMKPIKRFDLLETISSVLSEAARQAAQPNASAGASLRPLRILLVEDYKHNQLIVQQYLKQTPYALDIAENGAVAVEKYQSDRYDLVLMDLQMPIMDGYAATRAIRAFERAKGRAETPIIALTAYALKETPEKSFQAGCTAYLNKPVKKAQLLELIAQYTQPVKPLEPPAPPEETPPPLPAAAPEDERLIVSIDPDFAEFIPEFFEDIRHDLRAMSDALESENFEIICRLSHGLKGAGGGYGFNTISEMARDIEAAAKAEFVGGIERGMKQLASFIDEVRVVCWNEAGERVIII